MTVKVNETLLDIQGISWLQFSNSVVLPFIDLFSPNGSITIPMRCKKEFTGLNCGFLVSLTACNDLSDGHLLKEMYREPTHRNSITSVQVCMSWSPKTWQSPDGWTDDMNTVMSGKMRSASNELRPKYQSQAHSSEQMISSIYAWAILPWKVYIVICCGSEH